MHKIILIRIRELFLVLHSLYLQYSSADNKTLYAKQGSFPSRTELTDFDTFRARNIKNKIRHMLCVFTMEACVFTWMD